MTELPHLLQQLVDLVSTPRLQGRSELTSEEWKSAGGLDAKIAVECSRLGISMPEIDVMPDGDGFSAFGFVRLPYLPVTRHKSLEAPLHEGIPIWLHFPTANWYQSLTILKQLALAKEFAEGKPDHWKKRSGRKCYERDHLWLKWREEDMGLAAIRDRWNRENPTQRIDSGENGRDLVKKSIAKAKRERESTGEI